MKGLYCTSRPRIYKKKKKQEYKITFLIQKHLGENIRLFSTDEFDTDFHFQILNHAQPYWNKRLGESSVSRQLLQQVKTQTNIFSISKSNLSIKDEDLFCDGK